MYFDTQSGISVFDGQSFSTLATPEKVDFLAQELNIDTLDTASTVPSANEFAATSDHRK